MGKKARSARGEIVDFDLLSIKQQLATLPVNGNADTRRKFIDEKDRVQSRADTAPVLEVPSALLMAAMSAEASAEAVEPEAKTAKSVKTK